MTDAAAVTNALTDHAAECQRQRDELRRQLALAEAEGERLRVENAAYADEIARLTRDGAELRARHRQLLTALKPFARFAEHVGAIRPDDVPILWSLDATTDLAAASWPTVGDIRRAKGAYDGRG